ncbi:hypothetical protein CAPTEDRAFT_170674 [Capitella teleta]|uniref:F-box domain-containing protein n=1 Tax=Capitella teleta TaxID=283909 RepID=R7TTL6_CAPTE|nr:hypothetical protein CAPTEDRAFT_170674 [Capitella teleta]|eukprot:ELT94340.1 hypothetical protein CAPTEDRAFT_170674 [Capitella teleta]
MSNLAKNRVQSTWTPLGNQEFNQKSKDSTPKSPPTKGPDPLRGIFEERRALVGKWFDKWTDSQRKQVIEELMNKCKSKQVQFTIDVISKKQPIFHDDFTRGLPRVISLYIFSFLDPRSLCRCSQVCWHWKYLTEVDQIWMPKCCRLGWVLPFSPSPYETGVWKRLYIEKIMALKSYAPTVPMSSNGQLESSVSKMSLLADMEAKGLLNTPRQKDARPPWRGSDPTPKDIWRNNYLQNDDEKQKVAKLRKKGVPGSEAMDLVLRTKNKVNTGLQNAEKPSTIPRSKSATHLKSSVRTRPNWAQPKTDSTDTSHIKFIDPRSAAPSAALGQSGNLTTKGDSPPSTEPFPSQPWQMPNDVEYDSDVY